MNLVTRETDYGFSLTLCENTFLEKHLLVNRAWQPVESDLIKLLLRPGDLAVDTGAHVGWFSCVMAKAGARVLAFEPNPRLIDLTRANCVGLDVKVEQVALSDVDGEATFFLSSAWNDGWGSLVADDLGGRTCPVQVTTRRLDRVLPAGRIAMIKVDVEGAEAQLLRGLGLRLIDVDHLLIECVDIEPRVTALGSSVAVINELLREFKTFKFTEGAWRPVPAADSCFDHDFWFVNPRVSL